MNLHCLFQNSLAFARFSFLTSFVAASALLTETASARLGTFDANDGYTLSAWSNGYNWVDVTYYNAGDYGINAGGGSFAFAPPDTGKWVLLSNVGGFFPTSTLRNSYTSTAPPYPAVNTIDTTPAYLVGGHFPGRGPDGQNLAFRNEQAGVGPAIYDYYLDQYDMGANPATITSGSVATQFYFRPNAPEGADSTGVVGDKFTMSFVDTSGNIGVEWGYLKDSQVVWRTTPGPWNLTGITAEDQSNPNNVWDGVRIDINLTTDTFSFDYYDVGTNTWSNVVPAGTLLGTPMDDLTRLRWRLEDNVNGQPYFGKNYFDDFTFTVVPEPSAAMLAGMALFGAVCRRRR